MPLFARLANAEDGLAVLPAKYLGNIFGISQLDRRVVVGHGFHRDGFADFRSVLRPGGVFRAGWVRTAVEHQGGHDCQVGVERVLVEVLPQARVEALAVELAGVIWIDSCQLKICHQAIEAQCAAIHHHKSPFLDRLCRHSQLHLQVGFKSTAGYKADRRVVIAEICSWFHHALLQF